MNNDLTPKQQTSEAIRQAETIVITTGQKPNVDQVAAVLALSAILRKFGKQVSAIISDSVPGPAQFLDASGLDRELGGLRDFILKVDVTRAEVDKLRYEVEDSKLNIYITPYKGKFAPSDVTFDYGDAHYDLVIVLGVPKRDRLDKVITDNPAMFANIPLVNIDFHRINENYGAVNLIEPTASSLSEMLVALSESLQAGLIDADIATTMLAGLMASTDRFTAAHTTSKSLTVAAQLMAAGARQQQIAKGLFGREPRDGGRDSGREQRSERSKNERRDDRPARPEQPKPERREEPRREERPERVREVTPAEPAPNDEPLIAPDHIELMSREMAFEGQPQGAEEAAEPVLERVSEPTEMPAEPAPQPELPAVPMADFAAAAEILRARHGHQPDDNRDDHTEN